MGLLNAIGSHDFFGALTKELGERLLGLINRVEAHQATAATAAVALAANSANPVIIEPGTIKNLALMVGGALPAAGESMVVDIQKSTDGGSTWASILTSTKTLSSSTVTTARQEVNLLSLLGTNRTVNRGDRLRANLTYTAGGGPTPMTSLVVWADIANE